MACLGAFRRGTHATAGMHVPGPGSLVAVGATSRKWRRYSIVIALVGFAELQIGAREMLDLDQGAVAGFPVVGYAVTRSYEQRYPRTVAAFIRALERGQAMADSSRAVVEQAARAFLGVSPQTAAVMALPAFPLGVDRVRLQRVADAMQRFGLLKRPFSAGQVIG